MLLDWSLGLLHYVFFLKPWKVTLKGLAQKQQRMIMWNTWIAIPIIFKPSYFLWSLLSQPRCRTEEWKYSASSSAVTVVFDVEQSLCNWFMLQPSGLLGKIANTILNVVTVLAPLSIWIISKWHETGLWHLCGIRFAY